ncbi:hypothetical protein ZEAMMB73_Zm00001d047234 [Zea mays]|uniref:Uncharacterized protein n=1 Tax=Zea mays TaxID=4577 RepID=A0A1D6P7Y0_MAIZE|nr:hypothetical protein ZEAMMB73_Zm00001d047234 [Zea mays]
MARPSGINMASFSAVSNSGGAWRVFLYIFMVFLVTGRRKKNRPVRVFPTDKGTLWKTRSADGHAESWGRLISQSRLVRRFVWSANLFIRSLEERVKVPWPVLKKEVLLHYFELEYLKDVVVLIMKNVSNTILPRDIRVLGWCHVPAYFNARLERKTRLCKRVLATLKVLWSVIEDMTKYISPEDAKRLISKEV